MAIVAMISAEPGNTASASEYNKLIDNIEDLNARTIVMETGIYQDIVGKKVADTGLIGVDSSTWSSATKIITNLSVTFPAIVGAEYEVTVDATSQLTTGGFITCGVLVRNGGVPTAADTVISVRSVTAVASGLNNSNQSAWFTAAATTTYGVALFGWNAGGGGVGKLWTTGGVSANRLTVKRVG